MRKDPVGADDGGQTVGNDNRCTVAASAVRARPEPPLRSVRQARSSLHQAASRPGSRRMARAMAIRWRWPPDKPHAFFADRGVISLVSSSAMKSCASAWRAAAIISCLAGFGTAKGDVVTNAGREQCRFLRHQADILPRMSRKRETVTQILAAQPASRPCTRIVKTQQQMEQRRFAGTARPDKRDTLAARDYQQIHLADRRPAEFRRDRQKSTA